MRRVLLFLKKQKRFGSCDGPPGDEPGEAISATVVLVEDDLHVRRVTKRILDRAGLRVEEAQDAEDGLELVDTLEHVDLLMTDLVLPGMSGRELVDILRESRPDIRIVVISGYASGGPEGGGDLPADVAFLQKPFLPSALVGTVRTALTGP